MARMAVMFASLVVPAAVPASVEAQGARPSSSSLVGTFKWHACHRRYLCGSLLVPLDYAHPDTSGSIKLAVAERPAVTRPALADVFLNPGGPGVSGVDWVVGNPFPPSFDPFNVITWDPRGVGRSDPVECLNAAGVRADLASDPAPATAPEMAAALAWTRHFAASCVKNTSKSLLAHVSTLDTARDLDRLRAALGLAQLNYMGGSYGTYLGERYLELFPERVRAMVLDGVVDPALTFKAWAGGQVAGYRNAERTFFAWCRRSWECKLVLPRPQHEFDQLFTELAAGTPVWANEPASMGGKQLLTLGLVVNALWGLLAAPWAWPEAARGISDALTGDGSTLAGAALGTSSSFDNADAAIEAITCSDQPFPNSLSSFEELAAQLGGVEPNLGPANSWRGADCPFLPIKPTGMGGPVHVSRLSATVLVIGATGDPATPYGWAKAVAGQLGRHARLLTRSGPGHTSYPFSACVDNWMALYLRNLTLPPNGTVCSTDSSVFGWTGEV